MEKAFTSSSSATPIAQQFSKGRAIFYIQSKKGKLIESLSHYGSKSSQNEKEVLFKNETFFQVLSIEQTSNITIIKLEEELS